MAKRSFSLKSVLLLIFFAGVSTAAMTSAGRFWAVATSQVVVFCLLTATLTAYYHAEQDIRRFAFGVVLFGGIFFALNALATFVNDGNVLMYWPIAYAMPYDSITIERGHILNNVSTLIFALLGGIVAQLVHRGATEDEEKSCGAIASRVYKHQSD